MLKEKIIEDTLKHTENKIYAIWNEEGKQNAMTRLIPLSFAFNMALKNYIAIRGSNEIKSLSTEKVSVMLSQYFQNKWTADLFRSLKDNRVSELEKFVKLEYKLFGVVYKLRNYHSHYIHEQGIISLKDIFEVNEYSKEKVLSQADFDEAKEWFKERFTDSKIHKLKILNEKKDLVSSQIDNKNKENDLRDIYSAIKAIEGFVFENNGRLSDEAQLFIACMFLRESQANLVFAKWKWRGIKHTKGYFRLVINVFSHYCIKDKYSLNREDNQYLFAFRNILSHLASMPHITHPDFIPIYEVIHQMNEEANQQITQLKGCNENIKERKSRIKKIKESDEWEAQKQEMDEIQRQINELKEQKDELEKLAKKAKKSIIPIRQKQVATQWFLRYLEDNKLLKDFKIACPKTAEDRISYLKEYELENIKLVDLKEKIKGKFKTDEQNKLKEHYKELKRSFVYREASQTQYQYAIRESNAYLLYKYNGQDIRLTVPTSLLGKWVFAHLINHNEGISISDKIKGFIENYNHSLLNTESPAQIEKWYRPPGKANIRFAKLFPKSIVQITKGETKEKTVNKPSIQDIERKISLRLQKLQHFLELNAAQKEYWTFASKKKIDLVLDYTHYHYRKRVLENGVDEDTARRNAPREIAYLEAANYIRFFSKEKDTSKFNEFFSKYADYYWGITVFFSESKNLESLFNFVIKQYITDLKSIQVTSDNLPFYARLLYAKGERNFDNIKEHIKHTFALNICISPDVISIKDIFNKEWGQFSDTRNDSFGENNFTTEFSFMRHKLNEDGNISTNADFLMQLIHRKLEKNNVRVFKKNGKVKKSVYTTLYKLKTEELLLWHIAMFYRGKVISSNSKYDIKTAQDNTTQNYRDSLFETIYNKPVALTFSVTINDKNKDEYGDIPKGTHNYTLKVPPRELDDEFIYIRKEGFNNYFLWYIYGNKGKAIDFSEGLKKIRDHLDNSDRDIYSVLQLEKIFISQDIEWARKKLNERYTKDDSAIKECYLPFKDVVMPLFENIFTTPESDEYKYLQWFRNFALHYQIQNPNYYDNVKKILEEKLKAEKLNLPEIPVKPQKKKAEK